MDNSPSMPWQEALPYAFEAVLDNNLFVTLPPTLPAPARRTLRVPPQPRALALASNLRSSLAVYFLDPGRLLAADGPSTSPDAANALLPMSVVVMAPPRLPFLAAPPW